MIFVYPAIISGNIEERYLPGMIKTIELYYLHHITEAVSSGTLQFYITQNRITGKFSEIRLESTDTDVNKAILFEDNKEALEEKLKKLEAELVTLNMIRDGYLLDIRTATAHTGGQPDDPNRYNVGSKLYDYYVAATDNLKSIESDISHTQKLIQNSERDVAAAAKEKDKAPKATYSKGATNIRVDTSTMLDLRPTSTSITAKIDVRQKKHFDFPTRGEPDERSIPLSVKVVPMIANNFSSIYDVLVDDYYANKYSSIYKGVFRAFAGKLNSYFGTMIRKFTNIFIDGEDISLYKDILLNKKGYIDAGTFRSSTQGPSYQKYSAAIVLMSADDIRHQEQDFFSDPAKVSKLFKVGWNSFGVMNDTEQKLIFCSYYEGGMCTKIPYSHLFHSLNGSDLFKDLEALSGFTKRVVGKFKRTNLKKMKESMDVQNEAINRLSMYHDGFTDAVNESRKRINTTV